MTEIKKLQKLLKGKKNDRYHVYNMLVDDSGKTVLLDELLSQYPSNSDIENFFYQLLVSMKKDFEFKKLNTMFESLDSREFEDFIKISDLRDCYDDSDFLCYLYENSSDVKKKSVYREKICSFNTIPPTDDIKLLEEYIENCDFIEKIRPVFSHYDPNLRIKAFELLSFIASKKVIAFYVEMMKMEGKKEVLSNAVKFCKHFKPEFSLEILGKCLNFIQEDLQEDLDSVFREIASENTKLYLDFMNSIKDDNEKLIKAGNTLKKLIDIRYLHSIIDVVLNATSTYQLNSFFGAVENIVSYYFEKGNISNDINKVNQCITELERLLCVKDFLIRKAVIKILLRFKAPGLRVIMSYFGKAPKYDRSYLEKLFQNTSATVLFPILEKIIETKDIDAILPILELVKKSGMKEYIKLIVYCISLNIPEIKDVAVEAAIELGYDDMYKVICNDENSEIRYWGCYLLRNFPSEETLGILAERLYDPEEDIRKVSVKNLFYFQKFQEIYSLLEDAFDDPSEKIQESAIETLGEIANDKSFNLLQKKIGVLSSKKLKDRVIELITMKKKDEFLKNYDSYSHEKKEIIAKSIYRLDKKLIDDIRKKQSSLDRNERFRAAEILSTITSRNDAVLVPLLLKSASDPDKKIRAVIVEALGKSGNKTSYRTLLKLLNDPNPRVRANVVESLEKYGKKEEVIALLIPFLKDENNRVKANTIVALWRLGYRDIYGTLKEMLENTNEMVIASALYAIRNIDYDSNLDFLRVYFNSKSSILKFNLLLTIQELGIAENFRKEIKSLISSNDQRLCNKAKELLRI